ncbi:hypothetical protein [Streptomyces sp900116325]|uniref:hypothetical protein n=1 Tax=Streptomyces sp. 900116325 TaxID=3154295 RepID=UPI0033AE27CD
MTDEANSDDGEKRDEGDWGDVVWAAAGLFAGGSLSQKYAESLGYTAHENLPTGPVVFVVILLLGPMVIAGFISMQLRGEVKRGKSNWATYWSTTVAVLLAALAFVGITGVDDIFALFG